MTGEEKTLIKLSAQMRSISFATDSTLIAGGCEDGVLRIWDSSSKELNAGVTGHFEKAIDSVGFSRDGKMVATASEDSSVRVWSVGDKVPLLYL